MKLNQTNLTAEECSELNDEIAGGNISRSCPAKRADWFNIKLSTGRRVSGAYEWESEGDFLRLNVYDR